ncbi:MAG: hypothetical protein JSW71_21780 [Gemmatimonadota bacterium]|nr:MAG: hypothetical protein JSW71_21780 [Gemmatimonadota bacterium]
MTTDCRGSRSNEGGSAGRRNIYGCVLETFRRLGKAPTPSEIAEELKVTENVVIENLRALEADGALKLEPGTTAILDAYPYSAVPTKHIVQLPDGSRLHCMCAIDVFYVPFLTESDVSIESRCHYCDAAIRISVDDGAITGIDPPATVVWDSAATYDCPLTNFFCSQEHLRLWNESAPAEPGQQIELMMALDRGRVGAARISRELADS